MDPVEAVMGIVVICEGVVFFLVSRRMHTRRGGDSITGFVALGILLGGVVAGLPGMMVTSFVGILVLGGVLLIHE